MNDVTRILNAIEDGDPHAAEQLLPLVYDALRKLAAEKMHQENPGQTLQATALVHEPYMRLVGEGEKQQWDGRGHFFPAAAEAMRRILVENARRKSGVKHGGQLERLDIEIADLPTSKAPDELIALNEALEKLELQAPVKARLVTLRYFGGMTIEQASEVLGISRITAHRYWTYAKAFLHQQITETGDA